MIICHAFRSFWSSWVNEQLANPLPFQILILLNPLPQQQRRALPHLPLHPHQQDLPPSQPQILPRVAAHTRIQMRSISVSTTTPRKPQIDRPSTQQMYQKPNSGR